MKKVLLFTLSFLMLLTSTNIDVKAKSTNDYKTFIQTDSKWAKETMGSSSASVGSYGCLMTSVTILMAYANPDLRDVDKWNPGIAAKSLSFQSDGSIDLTSVSNVDKTFTKVKDIDKELKGNAARKQLKELYDQGYYLVVGVSGPPIASVMHYSPIVGFDGDKPLIWDVAGIYHDFDTWSKQGIVQIDVFQSSKNKSYDVMGKNTSSTIEESSATGAELKRLKELKEEYLKGMPEDFNFNASGLESLELPNENSLSDREMETLANIQMNMDEGKVGLFDIARYTTSMIGLLVLIYGVLLAIAYLFDRSNSLFEISLLAIVTLGKYKRWDETLGVDKGRSSADGIFYCTGSALLMRIVIIELVGFFLISSSIFRVLYNIVISLQ